MVLWKKESASNDACYVNLLEDFDLDLLIEAYATNKFYIGHKNNETSSDQKMKGNEQFKAKNWPEAIELYNKSLRYAPNDSENISFAYANRAHCFFKMEMYDKCLVDIEMAKKSNYPERLMFKLNERKNACLKAMNEKTWKPEENKQKMQSESFICMTNIEGEKSVCDTCCNENQNFVPCENCYEVLFCDDECKKNNKIHKIMCEKSRGETFLFRKTVQSILIALNGFDGVEEMMSFVESTLNAPKDFNVPKSDMQITTYKSFLKTEFTMKFNATEGTLLSWTSFVLAQIDLVKQRFQSLRNKRFLMHLILQHQFILETILSNGGVGMGGKNSTLTQPDWKSNTFVQQHSPYEIEKFRNEHSITINGRAPSPIFNFDEIQMPDHVMNEIRRQGYEKPTPIQAQGMCNSHNYMEI